MKITIVAVDLRSPAWAFTAVEDYLTRFPRDWKVELKTVKEEPRHGQSKSDLIGICQDTSKKLVRSLFIPEEPQQGLCPYASLPQDIFLT